MIFFFFAEIKHGSNGEETEKLDEARKLCKLLVDNTKESSTKFDLKNKLANVERPYTDLIKKIGM